MLNCKSCWTRAPARAGNLIDRFVVHELDQRGISMRQVRQAVEQPPAQMPQRKGAPQQGCHCWGTARDLDGPRGAQSGLEEAAAAAVLIASSTMNREACKRAAQDPNG